MKLEKEKNFHDELMLSAFNHCAEVIIIINEEGDIVEVNEQIGQMFGYQKNEILTQPLNTLFPERFKVIHKEHLKKFFEAPSIRKMGTSKDLYAQRKNGDIFSVEVGLSHFTKGKLKFGIAFVTDISLRKQSEKRLKATIDTAVDGISTISAQGTIISVNHAICELFGYSQHELIGHPLDELIPNHNSKEQTFLKNYLKGTSEDSKGETYVVIANKKQGDEFPIRISIGKFIENDEVFFTAIFHDMTNEWEAKKALRKLNNELENRVENRTKELANAIINLEKTNSELEEARKEADQALQKEKELNELKSRFVSMASHEFRTPLSTISTSNLLLRKYEGDTLSEKKQKHFERVQKNVTGLTNILNDFLSLDKLESGAVQVTHTAFGLNKLVEEVVEDIKYSHLKSRQKITINSPAEVKMYNDRNVLKNVLVNLLSNASKYSQDDQTILLNIQIEASGIKIDITDYGIGIPLEEQKHLFSRFFRAKNALNIQGTGLGLNIVKKYVELMDGTISFRSKAGETTFSIELKNTKHES